MTTLHLPDPLPQLLEDYLRQALPTPVTLDPEVIAYRWQTRPTGGGALVALHIASNLTLDDLLGIDTQKAKLVQNTRQY